MFACMYVHCVSDVSGPEEGVRFPGTGFKSDVSCRVGTLNQTCVFFKSNK